MPTGLRGPVFNMARPKRPQCESEAVRTLAKQIGRNRSASAIAADIARRVVADLMAYLEIDDPLLAQLAELESALSPTPVAILAREPEIDAAGEVFRRRAERFAARGCRQIDQRAWEAEGRAIAAEVEALLADRYRKLLAR